MAPGELITKNYKDMKENLPIPWIGMPFWYKGIAGGCWLTVHRTSCGYAVGDGISLMTYRHQRPANLFCVPGEPDAVHMPMAFIGELAGAYNWGRAAKLEGGVWRYVEIPASKSKAHTILILPHGESIETVFPNNGRPSATIENNLKRLNTDGRTQCAKCKDPLTPLWIGNTNLSYCPACEG